MRSIMTKKTPFGSEAIITEHISEADLKTYIEQKNLSSQTNSFGCHMGRSTQIDKRFKDI